MQFLLLFGIYIKHYIIYVDDLINRKSSYFLFKWFLNVMSGYPVKRITYV
jgi:hypothetical protein